MPLTKEELTARFIEPLRAQAAARAVSNPSVMHPAQESATQAAAPVGGHAVFIDPPATVPTISLARLAANRANAKLSKGALSPETKAICSQNHTIHGLTRHQNGTFKLLGNEDPAAFAALKQSLFDEHLPESITESILVNSMAESNWLSARAQRLQDTCMNPETGEVSDEKKFALYLRYQTTHTRAFAKSLNDLAKLRKEKHQAELGVQAQSRLEEKHQAELLQKEAKTRYQIAVTAEQVARCRDKVRDYEAQHDIQLVNHGFAAFEKEENAQAA